MKKWLLLTMVVTTYCSVSSQILTEPLGLTISPFAGASSSVYSKDFYWDEVYKSAAIGVSGGVLCGMEMKEPHGALVLNVGIQYDYNNYINGRTDQRFVEHYVGAPFSIGYRYDFNDMMSLGLHLGALPRMMFDYDIDNDNEKRNTHWDESLNKWHACLKFGLDLLFWERKQLGVQLITDIVLVGHDARDYYGVLPFVVETKIGVIYRFRY